MHEGGMGPRVNEAWEGGNEEVWEVSEEVGWKEEQGNKEADTRQKDEEVQNKWSR